MRTVKRRDAEPEAVSARSAAWFRRRRSVGRSLAQAAAAVFACGAVLLSSMAAGAVRTLLPGNPAERTGSAAVERWRPTVHAAAAKYRIASYTDLLLAVMAAESGGEGTDPMQASACPYNTEYPDGIADPAYSIDCGVHYLADSLQAAGVQSPSDLERIRLALQGYNYGNGYIAWAIARDGGYTLENAELFSREQKRKQGVSVYGNPGYCAAVLQYYPLAGLADTAGGAAAMLSCAAGELGTAEAADGTTRYGEWYGIPDGAGASCFSAGAPTPADLCRRAGFRERPDANRFRNGFVPMDNGILGILRDRLPGLSAFLTGTGIRARTM